MERINPQFSAPSETTPNHAPLPHSPVLPPRPRSWIERRTGGTKGKGSKVELRIVYWKQKEIRQ